jgi:hypothetical protein
MFELVAVPGFDRRLDLRKHQHRMGFLTLAEFDAAIAQAFPVVKQPESPELVARSNIGLLDSAVPNKLLGKNRRSLRPQYPEFYRVLNLLEAD